MFFDVNSLLEKLLAYVASIKLLVEYYRIVDVTKVIGTAVSDFLFGIPVALALAVGFVLTHKLEKLTCTTFSEFYKLEYSTKQLEIHTDVISAGENVLVIDDLLAPSKTVAATVKLI